MESIRRKARRSRIFAFVIFLAFMLVAGCDLEEPKKSADREVSEKNPKDKTSQLKDLESAERIYGNFDQLCDKLGLTAVSKEEAETWAKAWEASFIKKDQAASREMMNLEPLHRWVIRDIPLKYLVDFDKTVDDFAKTTINELTSQNDALVFRNIYENESDGVKRYHPVFRFVNAQGGVSYHYHFLKRNREGKVFSVDHYALATGERHTEALRRESVAKIPADETEYLDRFSPEETLLARHGKSWETFKQYLQIDPDEAATFFETMPEELKECPMVYLNYMIAISRLNDEEKLDTAYQDFEERFQGKSFSDVYLLDAWLKQQKYEEFDSALGRISNIVTLDLHVATVRARMLHQQGKTNEALEHIQEALKTEKESLVTDDLLISAYLAIDHFDGVLACFEKLFAGDPKRQFDITGIPAFNNFVASPQYDEFLRLQSSPKSESNN